MQRVRHELSTATIVKVCVAILAVWLGVRLWPILLVVTGALILVGTINPVVARAERWGLRRGWAVALVFVSLSVGILAVGLLTVPAFMHEFVALVQSLPQMQAQLAGALEHSRLTAPLATAVKNFQIEKVVSANAAQALAYSRQLLSAVAYAVTSIMLALYLVADRDRARGALYAWVPRAYHVRLARVLMSLERVVGGYMRGQLITSVAITVFAFGLLSLCHVPNALALACFAGLTDVIPIIGGLLATAPAVLAAIPIGFGTSVIIVAAFAAYQFFESHVLVPHIYGRAMRLSSATVLLALLVGGELLGVIGALIALPVAAGIRVVLDELRVDRPGDDSDQTEVRAHDELDERIYAARTAGADAVDAAAVAQAIVAETPAPDPPK